MDLAKQAQIVDSIHDTLNDFVGQRLKVRANMGRSKIVENEGVLMQVHPQLFILEMDRKRGRTARQSYQYVDVLTGMVELSQNGEPLFQPFIPEETDVFSDMLEDALEESVSVLGSLQAPSQRHAVRARPSTCVSATAVSGRSCRSGAAARFGTDEAAARLPTGLPG